jgi:hypothetical protein
MQFSKTAYSQLAKKHHKLKEYSEFINARNLIDDSIKSNSYFLTIILDYLYKILIF